MPPPPPSTYLKEADRLVAAGDLAGAADAYTRLLKAHPRFEYRANVRHRLGTIQSKMGFWDQSIDTLKKASREAPGNADILYHLAQAQIYAQRHLDATSTIEKVLEIEPEHPEALARRATLAQYAGNLEAAVAQIDEIDRRGVRHWSIELAFAGMAPRTGRTAEAIKRLQAMVDEGGLDADEHAALLFNLAYLLDREKRYDEAWAAAERANALLPVRHDPEALERFTDHVISTVDADAIRALPEPMDRAEDVVLIVGSPRSGTTLLEQIIAAHPLSDTAGELGVLPHAVAELARSPGARGGDPSKVRRQDMIKPSGMYLTALRSRTGKATRRIDKLPHNWQYLGTAAKILPSAHVIYCDRDPRDIAISSFFRNFVTGHAYTTRLEWIGGYVRACRRLMRHWERVIPEATDSFRITTARYEDVVASAEPESRRLVDFVGLPWDDACLRFQERKAVVTTLNTDQVGRGVYTDSLERWRRYEKHLGPFMDALGDEAPSS